MGSCTEIMIVCSSSFVGANYPQVDGDEDLARALQESLYLEESSPRPSASRVQNVSAGRR